jgi:hypothetical protein
MQDRCQCGGKGKCACIITGIEIFCEHLILILMICICIIAGSCGFDLNKFWWTFDNESEIAILNVYIQNHLTCPLTLISKASKKLTHGRRDYTNASLTIESKLEASLEANKNQFREEWIMEKQLHQKLTRMEIMKNDLRENQCDWTWHHCFSIRKEDDSLEKERCLWWREET